MHRVSLGIALGIASAFIDVALMTPRSFPDKRAALLGAFCARFALGILCVRWPASGFPVVSAF